MKDKIIKQYIGHQIKERREKLGINQEGLADAIKLSRVSVLNMEQGKHGPKHGTMLLLCSIFECTPNDLYPPAKAGKFIISEKIINVKKKKKSLKWIK